MVTREHVVHDIIQEEDLDDAQAALLASLVRAKANREQRTVIEDIAMAIDATSVCVDCARENELLRWAANDVASDELSSMLDDMRLKDYNGTVAEEIRRLHSVPPFPILSTPYARLPPSLFRHSCALQEWIRVGAASTDTRISEPHLQLIARNAATILAARFPRLL